MADYYSETSFVFELTQEQAEFAISVAECYQEEVDLLDDNITEINGYDEEHIKLAKQLAASTDYYRGEFNSLDFSYEIDSCGLWISSGDNNYVDGDKLSELIHLILKHFDLDDYVSFETSFSCSKLRLDSFGGAAYFITKDDIQYMSTARWIEEQIKKHKDIK